MKDFSKRLKGRVVMVQEDSMKKEISHFSIKFPILKGTVGFEQLLKAYQNNEFVEVQLR